MLGIRRNSLSYKTAVLYIVLTVLIISVFNFIIWENQSDLITRNQQLKSEVQSVQLRQMLGRNLDSLRSAPDASHWKKVEQDAVMENISGITIFAESGAHLFSSAQEAGTSAPPEEQLLLNRAIAKFELEGKNFYHELDIPNSLIRLYIPYQLRHNGEFVVARFPLLVNELEVERNILIRLCLLVAGIVILLQLIFALFLRRIIIKPIEKLEKATHEVAKGDFNQTIDIKQQDEIGMLASSFNEMILNLVRIREEAQGSNPLSGLPGNNAIIQQIEHMIVSGQKFVVIYADLDNFKAYNDKYGFSKGDDALLYTRDCFLEAARKFGSEATFVGHEGGDDFVIISPFDTWEPICKGIIAAFDSGVTQFYNESDAKQGFIDSVDRQGKKVRFPLMSISLAVVGNHLRPITDHRLVGSIAAEMKKYVKKMEGSSYAIDKRIN